MTFEDKRMDCGRILGSLDECVRSLIEDLGRRSGIGLGWDYLVLLPFDHQDGDDEDNHDDDAGDDYDRQER